MDGPLESAPSGGSRERERSSDRYRSRDKDDYRDRRRDRDDDRRKSYDRDRERSHRSEDKYRERESSRRSEDKDKTHDRERKREREDDVKPEKKARSPSPTTRPVWKRRVPRNIRTGWDKPPPEYAGMSVPEVAMVNPSLVMARLPVAVSCPTNLIPQETVSVPVSAITPQMRQARRLYVGNLPAGTTDKVIVDFFNRLVAELYESEGHRLGEPAVANTQINEEKNFAFMEFRNPEAATKALQFDGIEFQNTQLRVRRPKDYASSYSAPTAPSVAALPQTGAVIQDLITAATYSGASATVPDTIYKIFLGNVPLYLRDDQVKELLSSFGELHSFHMVRDTATGTHKGYAFCQYKDVERTDLACAGLHGIPIGDQRLLAHRANTDARARSQSAMMQAQALLAAVNPEISSLQAGELPAPMVYPVGLVARTSDIKPTRVAVFCNLLMPHEVASDDNIETITSDMLAECCQYGRVVDVVVPKNKGDPVGPHVGKVFVQFQTVADAEAAVNALAGRKYMGRVCVAGYWEEEKFMCEVK